MLHFFKEWVSVVSRNYDNFLHDHNFNVNMYCRNHYRIESIQIYQQIFKNLIIIDFFFLYYSTIVLVDQFMI